MSNLSDKEIDRLSREAADSFEPDASSLSWTSLEQKLVEQMPERPPDGFQFGRISPYIWGPAVVLIAGISTYFIKTNFYSKLSTQPNVPVSQITKLQRVDSNKSVVTREYADGLTAVQPATASGTNHVSGAGTSGETSASARENMQKPDALLTDHSTNKTTNSAKSGTVALHDNSSGITGSSAPGVTADHVLPNDIENPSPGNLSAGSSAFAVAGSASFPAGDGSTHGTSKYNMPLVITAGASPGKVKGNDSLLNSLAAQKSPAPQRSVHINRSLSIGFTLGADYTDGGGISNDQLSNNIGITLGYYLTNKLSVNTGFIYSNKFYWAPGNHQNLPAMPAYGNNTFAWAPDIEYVNGAFNMYEMPLTLRYDFAKNEKTRFFVNAGASSYFLVKQTNIYYAHNGGRRLSAWLNKDESPVNYWFGVADLSFGLETDLGKGFSFQAEPFFRIPFQKMGVENLKIYSYGFMLSFRYAPVLGRSKK